MQPEPRVCIVARGPVVHVTEPAQVGRQFDTRQQQWYEPPVSVSRVVDQHDFALGGGPLRTQALRREDLQKKPGALNPFHYLPVDVAARRDTPPVKPYGESVAP